MRIAKRVQHEAAIPTASMADIAFLLIIFFMVTTVYDVDRTNVKIPSAFHIEENEKGAAIVVVHQPEDSSTIVYKFSDGEKPSQSIPGPPEIGLEVSRIAYVEEDRQFIVKADGVVRYELIDEVLDTLRRNNASNVLLLTRPGVEGG